MKSQLVLGTANFSKEKYTNASKKLGSKQIKKILKFAIKNKIFFFDTANSYKNEKILKNKKIFVFTKLIPIKKNLKTKKISEIDQIILKSIENSKKKLGVKKIFCVLLHKVEDLIIHDGYVIKKLLDLKKKKLIQNIGLSIDRFTNLKNIILNKNIKYIQIPVNIYDNRWKIFFSLKFAKYSKKKIFIARSIFLRGLLSKKKWPNKINKYKKKIIRFNNKVKKKLVIKKIEELMFLYIKSLNIFKYIIFGASSQNQIKQILNFNELKRLNKDKMEYIQKKYKNVNKDFFDIINWE